MSLDDGWAVEGGATGLNTFESGGRGGFATALDRRNMRVFVRPTNDR